MRSRWIWLTLFLILFQIYISNLFAICNLNILKTKWGSVEEVVYDFISGLDGRITNCKFAMHANHFNDIQKKFMILEADTLVVVIDLTDSTAVSITALKICVFKQMVHSWHWKDIWNYPNGCIICLKSFSVGHVTSVKKNKQITMMKKKQSKNRNRKRKNQIHGLFSPDYFYVLI